VSRYAEQLRRTRVGTHGSHGRGSIEKCGIRVSPDDPLIGDACQFKAKVNERAFIYTVNFGTYDG